MPDEPLQLRKKKNLLTHPDPFIWLLQVKVPTTPEPTMLRLTPNLEEVEFGTKSNGQPVKWSPFPIAIGEITSDSEGGLPQMIVTVSSITREIMALLVEHRFLLEQPVELKLVHKLHLNQPKHQKRFKFEVLGANADEKIASFTLSARNLYKFTIPNRRIFRNNCGNNYRDRRCRFIGDAGNAVLGACRKTFDECLRRRQFQIDNGLEVIHPGPFRAAPGIPRRVS